MNKTKISDLLKKLSNMKFIFNTREGLTQYLCELLENYTKDIHVDNIGNIIARVYHPDDGYPDILLDAHMDQVGMVVTYIDKNGFLKVSNAGGVDKRLLIAQKVKIHTKSKILPGTIISLPPHLLKASDYDTVLDINDVFIDIGYSFEQSSQLVDLGDEVTFDFDSIDLLGDQISGCALDNRAGVLALLNTLDVLNGKNVRCGLSVLFSVQEELGLRGAKVACNTLNPDIAVCVDVSFGHTLDVSEHKCGKIGKGPMIGISPTLDSGISKSFIELSKYHNIPYQLEIMAGSTGTNADAIGVSGNGVKTGLLSIPLKYMHSSVETVQTNDIISLSDLLAFYIMEGGKYNV